MRFVIVFQYQGIIMEEVFDSPSWDLAYKEGKDLKPTRAETLAIYETMQANSKEQESGQLHIYLTPDKSIVK